MAAAPAVRRRETARERLEERVRAWIVTARGDIEVLRAEEIGERARVEWPDDAHVLEGSGRAAGERDLVAGVVEVAIEPRERVAALARVVRPARRDHADASPLERVPALGSVEDRGVDRVRDDHGVTELDPELAVLLEGEPRLEDRGRRELGVDPRDPPVGAVVEA